VAPLVLPIMHPAAILRGLEVEEPAQVAYLKRANDYIRNKLVPYTKDANAPPGCDIRPSIATVRRFSDRLEELKLIWPNQQLILSVDIENAGDYITLVGVVIVDLVGGCVRGGISVPFRIQGGINYWSDWDEHVEATKHLYRWMADPTLGKVFHNGISHDIPQLERIGFTVAGDIHDTLVMQHYCYPEMRKSLQYCATLYCGAPVWKDLEDND